MNKVDEYDLKLVYRIMTPLSNPGSTHHTIM